MKKPSPHQHRSETPTYRVAGLAILFAATSGCGVTVGWMPLNLAPHPIKPRPAATVRMFTDSKPTRPYVEVGLISSALDSEASSSGTFELLNAIREEAGRHGCDAVVVSGENKMATGSGTATSVSVHERTAGFRAVCVVFEEDG